MNSLPAYILARRALRQSSGATPMVNADTVSAALDNITAEQAASINEELNTQSSIGYATNVTIDFAASPVQTLTLTGNVAFATTNRAPGRKVRVIVTGDGSQRNVTFNGSWIWLGSMPTTIAINATAILTLECTSTTEASVKASWDVSGSVTVVSAATVSSAISAMDAAQAATSSAGLSPVAALTYAATLAPDFAAAALRTVALTGNLEFTGTTNRVAGCSLALRLDADGSERTLTFPVSWTFIGAKPTTIAANKTGVLSLTCFGTAETDVVAAWAVEE